MCPTFTPGDRLVILAYWPRWFLRKGQIIVGDFAKLPFIPASFYSVSKDQPPLNTDARFVSPDSVKSRKKYQTKFIKRIAGLPGDVIQLQKSTLPEPVLTEMTIDSDCHDVFRWKVPEHYYFVRGDNSMSIDSVIWGPIPMRSLVGIFLFKLPNQTCPPRRKPDTELLNEDR